MADLTVKDWLTQPMHDLLGCAISTVSPPPGRSFIQVGGEVAWDDCCDGQVWVRVRSINPSTVGAQRGGVVGDPCGFPFWEVEVSVGIVRCVAVVDDDGVAPRPLVITEDAGQMLDDMAALQTAIQCCAPAIPTVQRLSIGTWTPLGPLGGCAGGEWNATLLLPNCQC